jgi:hypothetical protein
LVNHPSTVNLPGSGPLREILDKYKGLADDLDDQLETRGEGFMAIDHLVALPIWLYEFLRSDRTRFDFSQSQGFCVPV